MKARIVERTRQNGAKKYLIQTRFLFWWFDASDYEYDSLAAEFDVSICRITTYINLTKSQERISVVEY